jgi:hypothetical protein
MVRRGMNWARRVGGARGSNVAVAWSTTAAQRAERAVISLPGGAPSYQFRADTVTLSSGNVATIRNRRGADALVVSAGTLAAPASDALFGGAQSIAFTGTQWLDSNLAASAWKFLHDGTGCEVFLVVARTGVGVGTAPRIVTNIGASGPGFYITQAQTPVTNATVNNYNGSAFSYQLTDTGALPLNAATYVNCFHQENAPIEAQAFWKETAIASASTSNAPSSSNGQTLRLGGGIDQAWNFEGKFAELLIFPRVLHEYERQIVREYIAARYGIAAPVLAGADRDIMSMLPFSWPRADAYNTAASKVTAWLDRARPGHTIGQASSSNQVANPATDAALLNALSAPFTGTQYYDSSLAAAAWAFMHGDHTAYDVFVPTDATNTSILRATINTGTGVSTGHQITIGAGSINQCAVWNGSTLLGFAAPTGLINSTGYATRTRLSGTALEQRIGATAVNATLSGATAPGAPVFTFVLGTRGNRAVPFKGRWADTLMFNRVLTAAEDARVQSYLLGRYNKQAA